MNILLFTLLFLLTFAGGVAVGTRLTRTTPGETAANNTALEHITDTAWESGARTAWAVANGNLDGPIATRIRRIVNDRDRAENAGGGR
jgi:hypothetical protein